MSKTTRTIVRMTSEEKDHLSRLAQKSGLSLSEYIRIRMIEEHQEVVNSYKKEMSIYGVIAYYVLGKMAKKQLTADEIAEARSRANQVLKKWKMSEDD